jgi:hypothetical protein
MSMKHRWNDNNSTNQSSWTITSPIAPLSTAYPTWTALGSIPSLHGERLAVNCLRHGMASPMKWACVLCALNPEYPLQYIYSISHINSCVKMTCEMYPRKASVHVKYVCEKGFFKKTRKFRHKFFDVTVPSRKSICIVQNKLRTRGLFGQKENWKWHFLTEQKLDYISCTFSHSLKVLQTTFTENISMTS